MHLTYADGAHGVRIFGGTRVALPVVTVPGKVGISLYAGDISTSREALITAKPSGRTGCDPVPDPGTGVYEQLLAALNDKVPKDQGTENAGKVLGVGDDGLVRPVAGRIRRRRHGRPFPAHQPRQGRSAPHKRHHGP